MGVVWLWLPVSLQRPAQWTMAAATAHVMIQWQGFAAAVLLDSLYSRTARPAKVKPHPHFQTGPTPLGRIATGGHRNDPFIHCICVSTFSDLQVGFPLCGLDTSLSGNNKSSDSFGFLVGASLSSAFQWHILSNILPSDFPLHYHPPFPGFWQNILFAVAGFYINSHERISNNFLL